MEILKLESKEKGNYVLIRMRRGQEKLHSVAKFEEYVPEDMRIFLELEEGVIIAIDKDLAKHLIETYNNKVKRENKILGRA